MPLNGRVEELPKAVPETLPGMGPPRLNPPTVGFSAELPTDPEVGALTPKHDDDDDEPTNVVTRPEP